MPHRRAKKFNVATTSKLPKSFVRVRAATVPDATADTSSNLVSVPESLECVSHPDASIALDFTTGALSSNFVKDPLSLECVDSSIALDAFSNNFVNAP